MSKKITPFEEVVCYHCLSPDKKLIEINFEDIGWSSGFDGFSSKVFLCKDCLKELNPKWYPANVIDYNDDRGSEYNAEEELFKFISNCDVRVKELFYNRYDNGSLARQMDPQDWIDFELEILPHEKCKEYGLISTDEKRAYEERFPKCANVFNVKMGKSIKSSCPFNTMGNKDGTLFEQTSTQCYGCKKFKEKDENFTYKEVLFEEKHEYAIFRKILLDPERFKKYKE